MRTIAWAIGLVLAGGCFTDSGGTGGVMTTSGSSTGGTTAPTSTGGDTGSPTSTGTGTDSTTSDSTTSEATTSDNEGKACDPWDQDCGAGLKCMPYATDGGDSWDANKCTPVGESKSGAPCLALKRSATSGYDTCGPDLICWEVNPDTLVGTCYSLCGGSPITPICGAGTSCSQTNKGVVNVCLETCDPLIDKCSGEQVCVPDNVEEFLCLGASGDDVAAGDACSFINECAAGSMCATPNSAALCDQQAKGCCLPFCSLKDPVCPLGLDCVGYFPKGMAPAQHVDLGLCQDAA